MSDQDPTSAVALVVALVALFVSTAQLLQAIFGTAEGFRRTNRQIMGPFSQTRDRVFHFTELRFETTFRTPHFSFRSDFDNLVLEHKNTMFIRLENSTNKAVEGHLPFNECFEESKSKTVQDFITSGAVDRISKLQRVLQWIDSRSSKSQHRHLIDEHSKAYAAGWLWLLDQLFDREIQIHHTVEGALYRHQRLLPGVPLSGEGATFEFMNRCGAWRSRPAIKLEQRSWDLMPPDVVRPLASIDLGDILTLCYRLRIEVRPEERPWSAEGSGHSFSPLVVQGLGTVVQYRFDPSLSQVENDDPFGSYFAPSEACDKLAFGIIPRNYRLRIWRDWNVNTAPNFIDSVLAHFEELGVSQDTRRIIRADQSQPWDGNHNANEALGESLLLLCPPLIVDGLGILKYISPYPPIWAECTFRYRESYLVLRTRLNEMYPGLVEKEASLNQTYPGPTDKEKTNMQFRESQNPPTCMRHGHFREYWTDRMEWVGAVLNYFERTQQELFVSTLSLHTLFGQNAKGPECEEILRQLRTALNEADGYLSQLAHAERGAYQSLVAAHVEVALLRQNEVKQEWLKPEHERIQFRDGTGVAGVSTRRTEIMHRYIDSALSPEDMSSGVSIVGLFENKFNGDGLASSKVRDAWFTMMLRGILWDFIHHPVHLPWLPYKSRYYGDSTLVMIA